MLLLPLNQGESITPGQTFPADQIPVPSTRSDPVQTAPDRQMGNRRSRLVDHKGQLDSVDA